MVSAAPRKGLTLLEVLITIFVMAIGFLSVLTLFPLAARKLARSIDSDRATLMAANATTAARILGYRDMAQGACNFELASELAAAPPGTVVGLHPSKVVHIDPVGAAGNATVRTGFNRLPSPALPLNSFREWVVSQDEMRFESTGLPEQGFRRGERYSCSFLYRRQQLNDPRSLESVVLVYSGRPIEFGNDTEYPLTPLTNGLVGQTEIIVQDPSTQYPSLPPDRFIARNSWLIDLSLEGGQPRWKKFYQVQSVQGGNGSSLTLTLDRAIDQEISNPVWIDYLFDWFDRGTLP